MNFTGHVLVFLFIFTLIAAAQCALLTLSAVGSALSGIGYYMYENYKCKYKECCTDEYIQPDLDSEYNYILLLLL